VTGHLERNCAEALPAFALTSYGAVAPQSALQQAAEYPGEGEWNCMVSKNVLIGLKLMIFFEGSRTD
jgi:hypothetical protein